MYAAVLDANVLVPNALCDTLLRLAERGFYRPLWSDRILGEAAWAVTKVHAELGEEQVRARFAAMNATFEDALVVGWESACAGMDLPDDNDRHVVAAAVRGGGQTIVTFNLADFPDHRMKNLDIEVKHPDEFLLDQLDLHPGAALQVLKEQAADLHRPPSDVAGVLNRLARCGAPRFADEVRLLDPDG
ncbi:MAG: PIN domain-containing protein [Acidimicrobiales bacterium]